ncbi:hypothetical protein V501_09173, partial [Pseudogymnoascus sp. VKM F-4519 (FW-2642)]
PSLRIGKPSTDRRISNSNINVSAADRDTNVDEASHSRFAFDAQAMPIATDKKNISLGSANGNREKLSSANITASYRNDALLDAYDLGLPPTTTEFPKRSRDDDVLAEKPRGFTTAEFNLAMVR